MFQRRLCYLFLLLSEQNYYYHYSAFFIGWDWVAFCLYHHVFVVLFGLFVAWGDIRVRDDVRWFWCDEEDDIEGVCIIPANVICIIIGGV
jgi:hypothetical protein